MKQILQNNKTGRMAVADVPAPVAQRGRVLVRAAASLISAGTEKMAVDEGRKSLLERARERPELVRQVIEKAKSEGVIKTINTVRSKLGSSTALGYSAAGVVLDVGEDVTEFRAGMRVACAGAGYASHAEVLSVPKNLCVRLPDEVSFEEGAFGTLGAIALQGVRLAGPTLGEAVVVIGLGLLGQITVQLLKANGCRVFGVDLDPAKVELARELGADDAAVNDDEVRRVVAEWSRGRGADAVLITAATASNQPIELAGEISRVKGRVVAVGMVGLDVPRNLYFKRELSLTVSMSYGPGRYDPEYEERGHDYPFAYVRWTENRNIEAFLDLVAAGRVNVERLITHRFSIEEGARAYQLIGGETKEPYLGIVLQYDTERELERRIEVKGSVKVGAAAGARAARVGMIGAGVYAQAVLLPHFKAAGADFRAIATAGGVTARDIALKYGFDYCASDADEILNDPEVSLVVVATRHNLHAELARCALLAGKHVFVEKPLALNEEELEGVLDAGRNSAGRLTVGFNRRFSPLARAAREFFAGRQSPLSISYRVNAGRIPKSHWLQDPVEGGGRIVGEVCHFVDLMHFLTGSRVARVYAEPVASRSQEAVDEDNVFVTLRFADGSNGSIAYLSEGDKAMPKERVEIFGGGKSFVLDDFRGASGYTGGREEVWKPRPQDKGQADEARAVCAMVLAAGEAPIELDDLATTTRATFAMLESLRTGRAVEV
ncbi:MAG TPA: bi-domain-containing oxidoreductase [Pyrinomonadaceae bacterium]|jgi:predicted dehydrogenase/threonine dehydrogenase-like Zn-dependent dehydrogenase